MAIILIVDDDPTVRLIAGELLRSEDHAIVEAEDGDEALITAAPTRPNPVTQCEMDAGSVELF